jgi:hypothetical protein
VCYGLGHKEVAVDLAQAERYYKHAATIPCRTGTPLAQILNTLGPENQLQGSYAELAQSNLSTVSAPSPFGPPAYR